MSTVSYHLDKMIRVGLVEVAGKKYGKRLQEVKLYRASSKPILLLPRGMPIKKHFLRVFEKIQIISLGISGLLASGVYALSNKLLTKNILREENITYTIEKAIPTSKALNETVMQPSTKTSLMPYILAILVFVVASFLISRHLMKKRL